MCFALIPEGGGHVTSIKDVHISLFVLPKTLTPVQCGLCFTLVLTDVAMAVTLNALCDATGRHYCVRSSVRLHLLSWCSTPPQIKVVSSDGDKFCYAVVIVVAMVSCVHRAKEDLWLTAASRSVPPWDRTRGPAGHIFSWKMLQIAINYVADSVWNGAK